MASDSLNQVGKSLQKTREKADYALDRVRKNIPIVERSRDSLDATNSFQMIFKKDTEDENVRLDLFFTEPSPMGTGDSGEGVLSRCEEFDFGTNKIQMVHTKGPGTNPNPVATITPSRNGSLLAWMVGYTKDSGCTGMEDITGVTDIGIATDVGRGTYRVGYTGMTTGSTITTASTYEPGFAPQMPYSEWHAILMGLRDTTFVQSKTETASRAAIFDTAPTPGNLITMLCFTTDSTIEPYPGLHGEMIWNDLFYYDNYNVEGTLVIPIYAHIVTDDEDWSSPNKYQFDAGGYILDNGITITEWNIPNDFIIEPDYMASDTYVSLMYPYIPGTVKVYVDGEAFPASQWSEYDPTNGIVYISGVNGIVTICYQYYAQYLVPTVIQYKTYDHAYRNSVSLDNPTQSGSIIVIGACIEQSSWASLNLNEIDSNWICNYTTHFYYLLAQRGVEIWSKVSSGGETTFTFSQFSRMSGIVMEIDGGSVSGIESAPVSVGENENGGGPSKSVTATLTEPGIIIVYGVSVDRDTPEVLYISLTGDYLYTVGGTMECSKGRAMGGYSKKSVPGAIPRTFNVLGTGQYSPANTLTWLVALLISGSGQRIV